MGVVSEEEKARNFYRAAGRLKQAESELEHLRSKCRDIAEFGLGLKAIFECGPDVREVLKHGEDRIEQVKKDMPWPDTSEAALLELLEAIKEESEKRSEAAEEVSKMGSA